MSYEPVPNSAAFATWIGLDEEGGVAPDEFEPEDRLIDAAGIKQTLNGTTHFFRHMPMMDALLDSFTRAGMANGNRPIRILAAPSSIGCEAYTLSAIAIAKKFNKKAGIQIDAFDLSPKFTEIARSGVYPWFSLWRSHTPMLRITSAMQAMMTHDQQPALPHEFFRVRTDVAANVRFLEPMAFEKFDPLHSYDAVIVNNLFIYMTPDQITRSGHVIERTEAALFISTHGRESNEYNDMNLITSAYVPARQSAQWRDMSIAGGANRIGNYKVLARLKP